MSEDYSPGKCNIGPAEIARRRRAGHVGVIATLAVLVLLLWIDAPPAWRLVIALPAAAGAAGYLQAAYRFCANFGFRGVYNFGGLGWVHHVDRDDALAADRRKAMAITLGSVCIGLLVALGALLL